MVTLGRLGEALLVRAQLVLRRPRRAVDALQLRVLLAPAPVSTRDTGEVPAVADQARAGHVGPAAEVFPDRLAVAAYVVVDREFGAADLDGCALGLVCSALEADELELERLVSEFDTGIVVRDDAADEPLVLADDALHLLLDRLEIVGSEGVFDAEVVVEAVLDRRTDAEVRLRANPLHRLREHVRGRMAQDAETVRAVDRHRLDSIRLIHHRGEIFEVAVHAQRDDRAVTERVRTRRRGRSHPRGWRGQSQKLQKKAWIKSTVASESSGARSVSAAVRGA